MVVKKKKKKQTHENAAKDYTSSSSSSSSSISSISSMDQRASESPAFSTSSSIEAVNSLQPLDLSFKKEKYDTSSNMSQSQISPKILTAQSGADKNNNFNRYYFNWSKLVKVYLNKDRFK